MDGYIGRGKVRLGTLMITEPLPLPDGSEVIVRVELAAPAGRPAETLDADEFSALPFFGMWADRRDLPDSSDLVREGRGAWHRRAEQSG